MYPPEELPGCLPKQLSRFTFPPAECDGSNVSTSLPTLGIVCLLDRSDPGVCKVVSHCGFGPSFPDG